MEEVKICPKPLSLFSARPEHCRRQSHGLGSCSRLKHDSLASHRSWPGCARAGEQREEGEGCRDEVGSGERKRHQLTLGSAVRHAENAQAAALLPPLPAPLTYSPPNPYPGVNLPRQLSFSMNIHKINMSVFPPPPPSLPPHPSSQAGDLDFNHWEIIISLDTRGCFAMRLPIHPVLLGTAWMCWGDLGDGEPPVPCSSGGWTCRGCPWLG